MNRNLLRTLVFIGCTTFTGCATSSPFQPLSSVYCGTADYPELIAVEQAALVKYDRQYRDLYILTQEGHEVYHYFQQGETCLIVKRDIGANNKNDNPTTDGGLSARRSDGIRFLRDSAGRESGRERDKFIHPSTTE